MSDSKLALPGAARGKNAAKFLAKMTLELDCALPTTKAWNKLMAAWKEFK